MGTKIGFIGQGWIGRHYADDFENRLYDVVRYALEEPYVNNESKIADCSIVFIAVPTPTTDGRFDSSAVASALSAVRDKATVVIKSTLLPGTTQELQAKFPNLFVVHSPEFLSEATAAEDAAKPKRNLIGIPFDNDTYRAKATEVLNILPEAPYNKIMSAKEAELVKYAGNNFLYIKVLFMNILYDLATANESDWETVREAIVADPRIGDSHTQPVHASGHETKNPRPARGAGGHCFIKDFEAMRNYYEKTIGRDLGHEALLALRNYNNYLLVQSGKDLDLLKNIYSEKVITESTAPNDTIKI